MRASLERLYSDYNREDSASDPVHRVRPFPDASDREVAGFCAAALAFGRVASVLNSIDTLFRILGPHPAAFVRTFDPTAPHPELKAMVASLDARRGSRSAAVGAAADAGAGRIDRAILHRGARP